MTAQEIFSQLSSHMLKGLMIHQQLANYYEFLGLVGYSKEHEQRYYEESENYHRLCKFYIDHYNMLIASEKVEEPKVIPSNWYKYTRYDVDISTRKNGVEHGFKEWKNWEMSTRSEYERFYKELFNLNEISASFFVNDLVKDVEEEILDIDRQFIELKSVDFDPVFIAEKQSQ